MKHAEFYFKNKFEKLVHLVGFIMGMESVNFHIHCDCMGQMHCPSNKYRNGAATVNVMDKDRSCSLSASNTFVIYVNRML
jgi:hypothetical protein